jgi:hypothetical protein
VSAMRARCLAIAWRVIGRLAARSVAWPARKWPGRRGWRGGSGQVSQGDEDLLGHGLDVRCH